MATPAGPISTEQIISAVSHLSLSELAHILDHILALQAERKAAHLSERESAYSCVSTTACRQSYVPVLPY